MSASEAGAGIRSADVRRCQARPGEPIAGARRPSARCLARGILVYLDQAPEALPIQSQRSALERLARLSTAALERLFAEHLDLGSYRLDAWQSGLVARRLDGMRRRRRAARGLYLGAYGYVENLVPKAPPRNVEPGELPEKLRDAAPVFEQNGQWRLRPCAFAGPCGLGRRPSQRLSDPRRAVDARR